VVFIGLLGLGIVAFVAGPANASTVYLECKIASPNASSAVNMDVTLNEGAGTAGFTIRETGYSVQGIAAAFGPMRVTWQVEGRKMLEGVNERYSIDRSTLDCRRVDSQRKALRTFSKGCL
jgi:hypothetical protein